MLWCFRLWGLLGFSEVWAFGGWAEGFGRLGVVLGGV